MREEKERKKEKGEESGQGDKGLSLNRKETDMVHRQMVEFPPKNLFKGKRGKPCVRMGCLIRHTIAGLQYFGQAG